MVVVIEFDNCRTDTSGYVAILVVLRRRSLLFLASQYKNDNIHEKGDMSKDTLIRA